MWTLNPIPGGCFVCDLYCYGGVDAFTPVQKGLVCKVELIIPHIATLTNLGKGLGFGLSLGLAAFGSAIGIGLIFMSVINSSARQPEVKEDLKQVMWLGFAVTEAITFFGLTGGLILLFLV
jgi:F-type H+-transporting ATPase subunit c